MDCNLSQKMSRRSFTKAAITSGVSATSLYYGTQEGLAQQASTDQVPYVKFLRGMPKPYGEGRRPVYDSIPREEWERRYTAIDVRQRVARWISQKYRQSGITAEFVPDESSPTDFGVRVVNTVTKGKKEVSTSQLRSEFEGKWTGEAGPKGSKVTRQGIPVVVKERYEAQTGCSENHDGLSKKNLDEIPGGVDIDVPDAGAEGSLTAPFYNKGGYGVGWIVAGHVVNINNNNGGSGYDVLQGEDGIEDKIGKARYGNNAIDADWAYIENTESGTSAISRVADEENIVYRDYPIGGIATNDTLKNKVGTDETFFIQGLASGRVSGTILGTGGGLNGPSYVGTSHDNTTGDSGGILFGTGPNDYYAYVAGTVYAQTGSDDDGDGCRDDTKSTTAETVEDRGNGYFMSV